MEIKNIRIGEICTSPMNPRKTFEEDALKELADNIAQQGLLQPITVRPIEYSGVSGAYTAADMEINYEIVCGERRYRAMSLLHKEDPEKWGTIAAIVKEMTDEEAFDAMITENLQRKDVDPIEEAYAFSQLIERGNTTEEVALRFGKSVRFVLDRVKLNNLIPELLLRVKDGTMAIGAGMIISKLDDELQRKFFERVDKYSRVDKNEAERFLASIFMYIGRSTWYKSGREEDKDFDGGCGRKCSECQFNTANANCLFWEMKTDADDSKCTNRQKFEEKHMAFLLAFLEGEGDNIVKKGEPLEYGKTVIIDTSRCWTVDAQRIHDETVKTLTDRGYEIVKPEAVFGSQVYYDKGDERVEEKLKNGEIYRCVDVLDFGTLPTPKIVHYYLKPKSKKGEGEESKDAVAPTEVVSLVGKHKRNVEIKAETIIQKQTEMVKNMGAIDKRGEFKRDEQIAFDILILSKLSAYFIEKHYKCRPTVNMLEEIATNNWEDRDLWYREYLRQSMSTNPYNGAAESRVRDLVLPIWEPDGVKEIEKIAVQTLNKRTEKIQARLEALGYDLQGNKLSE